MTRRIPTLLFYATGFPNPRRIFADTTKRFVPIRSQWIPRRCLQNRYLRFFFIEGYSSLSYVIDWKEAFCETPYLNVEACNINDLFQYWSCLKRLKRYPLVIILHSAAGDNMTLIRQGYPYFHDRHGKLLIFFGNEYTLLNDKIAFAKEVSADYIATQLPLSIAEWLYAECTASKVLAAPAALNPKVYHPEADSRHIDIGFRGALHSYAIGDNERTQFLTHLKKYATKCGLTIDMDFRCIPRTEWCKFLNSCKGIPGAESGTYYLEKDSSVIQAAADFLKQYPNTSFEEAHERFFKTYSNPVSGKAISSRHFEPIGTKTCQILLEGHYNGILKPDVHFICVKKDFSNLEDAIKRFKDDEYRNAMVEQTYEYVLASHTYRHRVDELLKVNMGI